MIGGDAAADQKSAHFGVLIKRAAEISTYRLDRGRLERRGEIRAATFVEGRRRSPRMPLGGIEDCGLQPAEGKVNSIPAKVRDGEVERVLVPAGRQTLDLWPARMTQAEHRRDLVKGFANRIINGSAEQDRGDRVVDEVEARVSATHHQAKAGEGHRG